MNWTAFFCMLFGIPLASLIGMGFGHLMYLVVLAWVRATGVQRDRAIFAGLFLFVVAVSAFVGTVFA